MNVRVRVLTIEYRALPIQPIHPSPTPTPTATGARITGVTVIATLIVTATVGVRGDAAVTDGDSVAW
jgi:hypothetical protein